MCVRTRPAPPTSFSLVCKLGALVLILAATGCTPGTLRTELVADGFDLPVFVTSDPNDASRLFVLEQVSGLVRLVVGDEIQETPFLDIDDKVSNSGGERGLFSLAFHPQYSENGRFFVAYSDNNGATVVEEYLVSNDPGAADPDSGRIVISIPQPFTE